MRAAGASDQAHEAAVAAVPTVLPLSWKEASAGAANAVAYATRAEERTIAGSVAELPALLAAEAPSGPVIVMIGSVFADHVHEAIRETAPTAAARQA